MWRRPCVGAGWFNPSEGSAGDSFCAASEQSFHGPIPPSSYIGVGTSLVCIIFRSRLSCCDLSFIASQNSLIPDGGPFPIPDRHRTDLHQWPYWRGTRSFSEFEEIIKCQQLTRLALFMVLSIAPQLGHLAWVLGRIALAPAQGPCIKDEAARYTRQVLYVQFTHESRY